jgi:hypothetical protein
MVLALPFLQKMQTLKIQYKYEKMRGKKLQIQRLPLTAPLIVKPASLVSSI